MISINYVRSIKGTLVEEVTHSAVALFQLLQWLGIDKTDRDGWVT